MAERSRTNAQGGIRLTETPEATVAHLWGEIDEASRHQAGTVLSRALDRDLPIVLDAAEVTFIDSAGIAFLIQLCTVGREEGLSVTLHDPPRVVSEVLEILGLHGVFADGPRSSSNGGDQLARS